MKKWSPWGKHTLIYEISPSDVLGGREMFSEKPLAGDMVFVRAPHGLGQHLGV